MVLGNPNQQQLRRQFLYDSMGIVKTCEQVF
jgi:hypothetical protein